MDARAILVAGGLLAGAIGLGCGRPVGGGVRDAPGSAGDAASSPSTPRPAKAHEPSEDVGPVIVAPHRSANLFADLPVGETQRRKLCARGHEDRLGKIFCGPKAPTIRSLVDLQKAVGLAFEAPGGDNGQGGNPAFVLLGHSTALTARLVSPVNPRALLFTPPAHTGSYEGKSPSELVKNPDFVVLGFTRGEQIVELIDRDPKTGDLRFFVVRFEQTCNQRSEGCTSYELFSPAIERDWTRISVYDDADLENTAADCNVCHQPNGYGTKRVLLMQALFEPWTHFFRDRRYGEQEQFRRYARAHEDTEAYAGIPGRAIPHSDPALLQGLVENEGFAEQPVMVDGEEGWRRERERAMKGEVHAVSYPTLDVVDEDRMARAAKAYRAVMADRAGRDKAPYLGDMHRPEALPDVGLGAKPDADARQILDSVCRRCHHAGLNPNVTRARFDVDELESVHLMTLERARNRLVMPVDDPTHMPPDRFGTLSDEQIERVRAELGRIIDARGGLPEL